MSIAIGWFLVVAGVVWLLHIWWVLIAIARSEQCDCEPGECQCLDDVEKYV